MKILSFNIREIYRDLFPKSDAFCLHRLKAMKEMLLDENPDIICFQEMTFPANLYIPKGYKRIGLSISHPIYIRKEFKYKNHKFRIHEESATIISNGKEINIINVHSHWNNKILRNTVRYISGFRNYIACGDFNNFIEDINTAGLASYKNIRFMLGLPKEDTFLNFSKPDSRGEIDHFYSDSIKPLNYKIITDNYSAPGRMSDHFPIVLDYE